MKIISIGTYDSHPKEAQCRQNINYDIDDNKETADFHVYTTKGKSVSCSVKKVISINPCFVFDS